MDPALQADVDRLDETVAGDRAALASAKASGLAAIRAARQKLIAFLVCRRVGGS